MQTPEPRGPEQSWGLPPPRQRGAVALTLPPAVRSLMQDDLARAVLILIAVAIIGLIVLDGVVTRLTPAGVPAAGLPTAAHVAPAFQDTPSRVQMNGNPLTLTLRATNTRVDVGYSATRYVFTATPPNDPSYTLCDGDAPLCALSLDGSRRQAGTWIITLRVYDNTGGLAETRTRVRVT